MVRKPQRCCIHSLTVMMLVTFAVVLNSSLVGVSGEVPHKSNPKHHWREKALVKDLLRDYDRRSRPVVDGLTPVVQGKEGESIQQITVEFGLDLIQILDLNEMDQVLTTSVRSLYRWKDYHLTWEPAEYDNISFVNIPPDKIWLPDIALYNYADERLEEKRQCDARVYHDGNVTWHPMAIYKSTCSVHIRFFPFDQQRFYLKFGPWTFDGWRVNITLYNNVSQMNLDHYEASPEWILLKSTAVFSQIMYPCCPEPYPDIKFYVWMKRQPAFYTYILILPCFLLSSLTLVLFWLPPETPAKMVLGMNIFVAFFLLLLLLEDTIPSASSSFPLIGTYYCLNMGIITLSTFLSCIIVNFHFRGDNRQEVPYWLKRLVLRHMARLLCLNVEVGSMASVAPSTRTSISSEGDDESSKPFLPNNSSTRRPAPHDWSSENYDKKPRRTVPNGKVLPTLQDQPAMKPPPYFDTIHDSNRVAGLRFLSMDVVDPWGNGGLNAVRCQVSSGGSRPHRSQVHPLPAEPIRPNYSEDRQRHRHQHETQHASDEHEIRIYFDNSPDVLTLCEEDNQCDPSRKVQRLANLSKDVNDIVKYLRYIQRMYESKAVVNRIFSEWRAVGMVLDRLFFVSYLLAIVLSIALFFTREDDMIVGDMSN